MDIADLLSRLHRIERELEQLSHECADLYQTYDGTDFAEQHALATNTLDNLVLAATHEMASSVGFMRADLATLTQFIAYRKRFHAFNNEDLALLIDAPMLNAQTTLRLKSTCATIVDKKDAIKAAWRETFQLQSYAHISSKFTHNVQIHD